MVSSAPPGSVAADSNVLLAAVARRAAWRVFEVEGLVVVTTEVTLAEVQEHAGTFALRYQLDVDLLHQAIELLPIERYSEQDYLSHMEEARRYLQSRDPDDVHLGALALRMSVPIWSNDDDLRELPLRVYTTAKLLKVLGA
jgi:predicted nucleic acid-binding protein